MQQQVGHIAADSLQSRLDSINNGQWDEAWIEEREQQRGIIEGTIGLNIPALPLRLHGLWLYRDGDSAITWVYMLLNPDAEAQKESS